MSDITDRIRELREAGEGLLKAFTFGPGAKGIEEHRRFDKALSEGPNPKELANLQEQNAQLHDELGTRADALGERARQRDDLAAALREALSRISGLSCSLALIDDKHTTDDDAAFCRRERVALAKLEKP